MTAAQPTLVETRMRDGVGLAADLHRPEGAAAGARHPTLLFRTPYGKSGYRDEALVAAALARGYAVFVQDVRGRYASQGAFDPYRQEGRDGYDTIEWIAAQPWSDGKVATAGLSYPGAVQWLAAIEAPPHLVCAFPAMCFSSARQFFYFGGAFDLSWIPWIANNIAPDARRRRGLEGPKTGAEARAAWRKTGRDVLRHVPLNTLPLFRDVAPFYYEWLDHPDDGDYWSFADIESRHDRVRVPTFNFSGWHDEGYGPIGAVRNFTGVRARAATPGARTHARLLIGPWTHGDPDPSSTRVGDREFGREAGLDYVSLVLDWCDWHVKGIDRGLDRRAPVRIFVMGENRWRDEAEWPIPGTRRRDLFLRAGHRLSWSAPGPGDGSDRFVYDPNDPVVDPHFEAGLGAHDQRSLERRRDVLAFTSDPLSEPIEVTGHLEFRIWMASTAVDTDIYARLLDVAPDGTAWNLMSPTLEVLRVRYRDSEREPAPLLPGRPYELSLRSGITSNRFDRGHRIRVQITSSFFPHLDRNPNTGRPVSAEERLVPATQTIFHDGDRPSRVILPIVER
jgi:putative CocE/NonD family hydrolase